MEKLLGKGSYGEVAQGTDSRYACPAIDIVCVCMPMYNPDGFPFLICLCRTGKKVAIKFMKDIFAQPTDAKRAYREMHILR